MRANPASCSARAQRLVQTGAEPEAELEAAPERSVARAGTAEQPPDAMAML